MKDVKLEWSDLTLENREGKVIDEESGVLNYKTLTALLGTSGAGKTSLLNSLAGRVPESIKIKGSVLLNNKERDRETWTNFVAYVEQFFRAYENQSVYETIRFSAILKRKCGNAEYNLEIIDDQVLEIIKNLGLNPVKDKYLCEISGGELKRVSIGLELIGNPKILFLDEPTSGLDSFNALNTIEILKKLADDGRTILLTIHQPSYKITLLFNRIFIMAQGKSIFQGNINECIGFFEKNGYVIPENTNPCDYFLDMISLNPTTRDTANESQKRINKLKDAWIFKSKDEKKRSNNSNEINSMSCSENIYHTEASLRNENSNNSYKVLSWLNPIKIIKYIRHTSFPLLFSRNMIELWRDKKFIQIQIFQKVVFTLLLGLAYLQLGYSEESIQSRTGVIFFLLINSLFATAGSIFNVFPEEKKIIYRERKSGLYNGFSAYFSKLVSLFIYNSIFSLVYISAVYWLVGLYSNAGKFFVFLIIQISAVFFSICLGLTIGTLAPTQNFSQLLGTTILIIFIIFGGGFNNPNTIPAWLRWIIWISPVNYSFRASMQNQYKGLFFDEISGEDVIIKNGLETPGIWPCLFILWGLTGCWIVIGAFSLHYLSRIKLKLSPKS